MSLTLGRISFFTFWAKSLPKGRMAENTQDIGKLAEKAARLQGGGKPVKKGKRQTAEKQRTR